MENTILPTPERNDVLVELHFQPHKCVASTCIMHFPVHVQLWWPGSGFPGAGYGWTGGEAMWVLCSLS